MGALGNLTLTRKLLRSAKGALTAKQLAEVLNISPKTVFKLANAGRIPSFRVGTSVRFDAQLIVEWMRRKRKGHF
jgi:excisionase family DNA binding protein